MEYFALKTPEQIKEELDTASDTVADTQYDYRRLEEHKKIAQEQLTLSYNNYKVLADGVIEAERKYSKAKSNYANLLATLEYMRSWIATQRHISK